MGIGVRQDIGQALRWYREATDQGYAQAQAALGAMYQRGDGVPKNGAVAAGWYRKAAEQGVAEAQWLLGQMYADGEGVPQDDVQALAWMAISGMGRLAFSRSILDTLRERMTAG
jgi:TPR repeat protein